MAAVLDRQIVPQKQEIITSEYEITTETKSITMEIDRHNWTKDDKDGLVSLIAILEVDETLKGDWREIGSCGMEGGEIIGRDGLPITKSGITISLDEKTSFPKGTKVRARLKTSSVDLETEIRIIEG